MKIVTVVGARPQFIKSLPVSLALAAHGIDEILVHTGQHYDHSLSGVFFEQMGLVAPRYALDVGSASHGTQTAHMLERIEQVLLAERPDGVVVYGDTNSTVAGALAAVKLHIPVAHVEAGLRSFNRRMPEEINRVVTDHVSSLLFAPTDAAVANLAREGIVQGVVRTGDVMLDTVRLFAGQIESLSRDVLVGLGLVPRHYVVATVHRAENTDDETRWRGVVEGLRRTAREVAPVVWPVHPRVRDRLGATVLDGVRCIEPLGYFEMQALLHHARVALTDSGGLQKEAAFARVPCVTLRDETEWTELVACGANRLAGTDPARIVELAASASWPSSVPDNLYGDGHAAAVIAGALSPGFAVN